MKNLVITICAGEKYQKIGELTHPSIKRYAEKIGAEFLVIDKNNCSSPHWEKFQIFTLLNKYDRIIYLDSDIIVREDCPNLFDIVPKNQLGMFNEMPFTPKRDESLSETLRNYEIVISKWNGKYYNTGVMVISREHKYMFKKPEKELFNFYEQGYLNAVIARENDKFRESQLMFDLPYQFNRMTCMDNATGEERYDSYIIHYAGFPNLNQFTQVVGRDIEVWNKKEFKHKRHILIDVQGGLGDQVCAEPAIRYMVNNIYPNDDVNIKTHFPVLFKHINAKIFTHEKWQSESDTPYYKAVTLPSPETVMWSVVSNLLCHTVDFCSMAILKRMLPIAEKQQHLEVDLKDLAIARETTGVDDLTQLVLLHPGRHWESKTFPKEWWQGVLDELLAKGFKVCLIGKDEETRGVWDIDARTAIDTRNLLDLGGLIALISQAGVLISNDSGPVHIAGAFDNHIVLIPSCKHPDHILPYRNGNPYHKATALYKKLMINEYESAPTTIHGSLADKIPSGANVYDYLPDIGDVIEGVIGYVNR